MIILQKSHPINSYLKILTGPKLFVFGMKNNKLICSFVKSMNYFQMNDDKLAKLRSQNIKSLSDGDAIIVGDTKDWYDEELDVSDIPATLLFTAINNSYSTGFALYIGIDISFEGFCQKIKADLKEDKNPYFCGSDLFNFEELNQSGKIPSTKIWNKKAAQKGILWTFNGRSIGSIQGIVEGCRKFLTV